MSNNISAAANNYSVPLTGDDRKTAVEQANAELERNRFPVVFDIYRENYLSDGAPAILRLPADSTNVVQMPENLWIADAVYLVPRAGFFLLSVSYLKDSISRNGTNDDTYITVYREEFNTKNKDVLMKLKAGESTTDLRGSCSASVVRRFNPADAIFLLESAEEDKKRLFSDIRFSISEIR